MSTVVFTAYQTAKDYFLYEGTNHVRVARISRSIHNALNNQDEASYDKVKGLAAQFQNTKEFYYVDKKLVQNKEVDIEKIGRCLDRAIQNAENNTQNYFNDEDSLESTLVERIFYREHASIDEIDDNENSIAGPIENFDSIPRVRKITLNNLKKSYNRDMQRNDGVLSEFVYSKKFEKELAISATIKIAIFTGVIVLSVCFMNIIRSGSIKYPKTAH